VQFLSKLLFPIRHRFAALHTIFEGRRLFDKLRAGDVLVVRWVDRSARIYEDVCDPICEFMRRGVAIRTVIKNLTFDGATQRCRAAADCDRARSLAAAALKRAIPLVLTVTAVAG
jgi:hypothetical protein